MSRPWLAVHALLGATACGRIGFTARPVVRDAGGPARCDPATPFDPPVAVTELDQSGYAAVARLAPGELEVFLQLRPGGYREIYVATRAATDQPFGAPRPVSVDDPASDTYDASIDPDDLTLLFDSPRAGGPGGIDIYRATRATPADAFGTASLVTSLDTPVNEDQVYLMGHHDAVWYNSVAGGSEDLYEATWNGNDFGAGAPVAELNTTSAETFPTPSADGTVIYFGSDRSGNMDIYVATRPSSDVPFGGVARVAELASTDDDQPSWISPDLCRLFFTRGNVNPPNVPQVMVARRAPPGG